MKIGVLFCGFNSEDYVEESLKPFVDKEDFVISAVSVPFLEYKKQEEKTDKTLEILKRYLDEDKIQYLVDFPKYIREHEARDLALDYLLTDDVDYIWLVDADECYTTKQIDEICRFIKANEACWYKISLKNYVFDKKHYLKEPFCPPRIFSSSYTKKYINPQFYWDNDICYEDMDNPGKKTDYKDLPYLTIPKEKVWVKHYSWLSDETGKRKVTYQNSHFGEGNCSFSWNNELNQLEWNKEFHEKNNINIPETLVD